MQNILDTKQNDHPWFNVHGIYQTAGRLSM